MSSTAFVDTSIQVARMVHGPAVKAHIRRCLAEYSSVDTGLVVRAEFRRRLLREAVYLITQLNKLGSFAKLQRHVHDVLPKQQDRKRRICLQTLFTLTESIPGASSDKELTERALRYFRVMLVSGLEVFDRSVDHIRRDSGCALGQHRIVEKKPYSNYDFGPTRCSSAGEACGIRHFLELHRDSLSAILKHLEGYEGELSKELTRVADFIGNYISTGKIPEGTEPCLHLGDLLIALESVEADMYTINGRESQHLCRALKQTLVLRPANPEKEDRVYASEDPSWPPLSD